MEAFAILVQIRDHLGITRADLARFARLSPSTIGRIEKGTLDPTWGTLTRVLESTGFRLHGEGIEPICDPSVAAAARIALDYVLHRARGDPPPLPLPVPDVQEPVQVWLDRWQRVGWLTKGSLTLGLCYIARTAAVVSDHARRDAPCVQIGDARRWRELALRIDEAGVEYAVSDLPAALELPSVSLTTQPRIYVHDPATVATLLREEESSAGNGVLLVGAVGAELDQAVDGFALRFTSLGQAIMDGFAGTEHESRRAELVLRWLLVGRVWQ